MANLLGQNIGTNYKGILNLNTLNGNLLATLQAVTDGDGNASPLQLSTTQVNVGGGTALGRLVVRGDGTNPIARFENNVGTLAISVSNAGQLSWAGGDYLELTTSGRNLYTANILSFLGTWVNASSYVWGFSPSNSVSATSGTHGFLNIGNSSFAAAAGSANFRPLNIAYTINNSGAQTGTATGIFLNATETALNGMTHNLIDLQVGGVSRFRITNVGDTIQANSIYVTGPTQFISSPRFRGANAFFFLSEGGADGTALFTNSTQNGFNRLQFGGTTNAFPSIKRNGTGIDFRLADDSALCSISISSLDAAGNLQLGATGNIRFAGITKIQSPAAGIITLGNDAVTDFNRLQFGGTTSSFPAIARSGANAVICLADAAAGAGLGVGMASATGIAATAILQADSTTKGFLPPRMTTAQRDLIVTPAAGLVIYNTSTNVLNFYNGSAWGAV